MRPLRRHRGVQSAVLATAACLSLLAAVTPAAASPAAGSPASRADSDPHNALSLASHQEPLLDVADQIVRLTGKGTVPGYSGYADIALSPSGTYIDLYWKGVLPAGLQALLSRNAGKAQVKITRAPYTWQELQAQLNDIKVHRFDLIAHGITVSRITPQPGATGLEVGVDDKASPALRASATPAAISSAAAVVEQIVPGPAPITIADAPAITLTASRDLDWSPWWGGSRIVRAGNVACSSGFAVTIGGADYLLTAGHCGGINTNWEVGNTFDPNLANSRFLGNETSRIPGHDTAIIKVAAGTFTQAWIYDKGWTSTVGERVIGTRTAVRNSSICTEGATSGARCAGTVDFADFSYLDPDIGWIDHLTSATSANHLSASGDSGGPVIINSATAGQVYATGTVTGSFTTTSCPTNIDMNGGTFCSHDVVFEGIDSILSDWHAAMK